MGSRLTKQRVAAAGLALGLLALTACSGSSTGGGSSTGESDEVTITVGNQPDDNQPEQLELFNAQLEAFRELHPNITIEAEITKFDPQTFNAQLSGGTLPTTMTVPFTHVGSLIEQGAALDLTDHIDDDEIFSSLNPALNTISQDTEGSRYGITVQAYTFGLIYNRDLYEQVGLDPDSPPTTWDGVRENARLISDELGATGFTIATTGNTGGWTLTAMSYSNGDTIQELDGDQATATIASPGVETSLQFLRDLRWEDESFGSNVLLETADLNTAFAAGDIGQYAGGADVYRNLVTTFEADPESIGIGPLPQSPDGLGTLGGGSVSIVNPTATEAEAAAALEWVKYSYLQKYSDEDAAVADAEAAIASGVPVGLPQVPLFDEAGNEQYLSWIEDSINVNRDNYTVYLDSISALPVVAEPAVAAGSTYGLLSTVVQDVLTDPDVQAAEALAAAESEGQALIDAES
ncbi:extracellular solute-binding protein [Ruania suaedae]|uniref:ABC transporter substrate-binding protein n=1 Tax=Ruania suaedae TaxID=2897774 RepID=UPI001E308323|nr:extracellular solute-binding protein [Ruania suaedae]UFU02857.1 extracellular solute-binding protein [Ruania suaedae]